MVKDEKKKHASAKASPSAESSGTHVCFVISPIGSRGTERHEHFKEVLEYLIKPAVERCGYDMEVIRADDIQRPGSFVKDILLRLMHSFVVIADLTDQNPNVFYELGVRHSLSPRTILVSESMDNVPSDLKEYRTIEYEMTPRGIAEFSVRLKGFLKEIHDNPDFPDNPVLDRLEGHLEGRTPDWHPLVAENSKLRAEISQLMTTNAFPGPKVAEAWVYTVVNPLISVIEREARHLAKEEWGFARWHQDRLEFVNTITDNLSGNDRQFFQHNQKIHDIVLNHDEKVDSLIDLVKRCYLSISQSAALDEFCEKVTSLDSMLRLRDESVCPQYYTFRDFDTREQFIDKLFSPRGSDDVKLTIAEYILNNAPKLSNNITFAPLWNLFYDDFFEVRKKFFSNEAQQLSECNSILSRINRRLLDALKREQDNLCTKYLIPVDEPPPTVVPAPSGRFS